METIISSQRYVDDSIVAAKQASSDFEVSLSPAFDLDGETYRVVLDGHHALAAAKLAGVEPTYAVLSAADHDAICLLDDGKVDDFLEAIYMDSDYYDIATGRVAW